jgi:hypothetical protein
MEQDRVERLRAKGIPEFAIPKSKKVDTTKANGLTDAVIGYIKGKGGAAYRCSVQGQYDAKLGKFRKGGMKKGLPDIIAVLPNNIGVHAGKFLGIEIKIGKDKQSEHQALRQKEIESSGGFYMLVSTYDSFIHQYNQIVNL